MIITDVNIGQKANFSLSDKTLKIGNQVTIDLESRQKDVQNVVDVCLDNQLETMREGLGAWYVATIVIPAKQREPVPNGEDEEGNTTYIEVERPLDISKVELRLWSLPENYGEQTSDEGVTE